MTKDSTRYPIEDVSGHYSHAREAVGHAIQYLEALLAKPRFIVPKGESRVYLELRRDMPYCIHETSLPSVQILVNRNYKPLGSNSHAHDNYVKYEEYPGGHVALTREQISAVVSPRRTDSLFGDENPPWRNREAATAYLERLKALSALLTAELTE